MSWLKKYFNSLTNNIPQAQNRGNVHSQIQNASVTFIA